MPVWLASIAAIAFAQQPRLNLPWGPVTRLVSPDGAHTLYGVPWRSGVNDAPQLWIENMRTGEEHMLLSLGSTLSADWSPDGTAFSVNNHWASDREQAYIYDAGTLQRLNLGDRILAGDPEAKRFANGHAYFEVEHWDGSQYVIVNFHGHTDEAPVRCFDLQYRLNRDGDVEKLPPHASPPRC
jgi:hypothetical protein